MYWADEIAQKVKERNYDIYWVDDMKTPSGRIHVGSLRAVTTHHLVYKAISDLGLNSKFTYVFDNHDPMDGLPSYLDKEKYEKYLGVPLFMIPAPAGEGDFATYYAKEFEEGFRKIGCNPEIIWAKDLYLSGKMNDGIKKVLDNADKIRKIYSEIYKKEIANDWYPFNPYCPQCNKVSTTKVNDWDGEKVSFECKVDGLDWVKGCGFKGEVSPFATNEKINGKLPWKVEWAVKWQAIGITVEGAGKDHMTAGGSHDLAKRVAEEVLEYKTPYSFAHEFFLIGGKKMSSSKGAGVSVKDLLEALPPQLVRFLIAKTKLNQAINFDPEEGDTIPKLFDEYQEYASHYFEDKKDDYARIFEQSQVGEVKKPTSLKFSKLVQLVQSPNGKEEIEKENAEEWVEYAKIWIERFAPEKDKFLVQKSLPDISGLSERQKEYLKKLSENLVHGQSSYSIQQIVYDLSKELSLKSLDAFKAIYISLLGNDHGPKASDLIASLDIEFVKKRFEEASSSEFVEKNNITRFDNPKIFTIDKSLSEKYPSISIGIATIKGVNIEDTNKELEAEKEKLLNSLKDLTTEELGQYSEIISYRKLYKEMGVDWHSRRPSPEALLRRVALKKGLYSVNTCVDAYNLVVMKNRISVGAFDLDAVKFPTVLRFAKNSEEILLLGDDISTKYTEKEIAYFDQAGGYNMDFNYRDAQRTSVKNETKNLLINVDGVYDISPEDVEKTLKETCDVITKFCGGKVEEFGVVTA